MHFPMEGRNLDVAEVVLAVSGNREKLHTVSSDDLMFLIISSEDKKARDNF